MDFANCTFLAPDRLACEDGGHWMPLKDSRLKPGSEEFFINIGICVLLVCFAGVFSGLTLGLLSEDVNHLKIISEGGTEKQKKHAKRVLPLVRRHHLLLVTLLLSNAAMAETLPLFLDDLVPTFVAVIVSVTAVLMFGEVIPQAICSKHGLAIGSFFTPFVMVLMVLMLPVSYPISKLLDWLLGAENSAFFRRAELGALVSMHGENSAGNNEEPLSTDEVAIIRGALTLGEKTVADAMQSLDYVYMLQADRLLDAETLDEILEVGHSRIPVYTEEKFDTKTIINVKTLVKYDPRRPVRIGDMPKRNLMRVPSTTGLYDLLHQFQTARSHLAAIVHPETDEVLGIITLEDVVEELIGDEIIDDTDNHHVEVDVSKTILINKLRRQSTAPAAGRSYDINASSGRSFDFVSNAGGREILGQSVRSGAFSEGGKGTPPSNYGSVANGGTLARNTATLIKTTPKKRVSTSKRPTLASNSELEALVSIND